MASDPEAGVRLEVARRLDPVNLGPFAGDADWRVRYEIVLRADVEVVRQLLNDEDPIVCEAARDRISSSAAILTPPALSSIDAGELPAAEEGR